MLITAGNRSHDKRPLTRLSPTASVVHCHAQCPELRCTLSKKSTTVSVGRACRNDGANRASISRGSGESMRPRTRDVAALTGGEGTGCTARHVGSTCVAKDANKVAMQFMTTCETAETFQECVPYATKPRMSPAALMVRSRPSEASTKACFAENNAAVVAIPDTPSDD